MFKDEDNFLLIINIIVIVEIITKELSELIGGWIGREEEKYIVKFRSWRL